MELHNLRGVVLIILMKNWKKLSMGKLTNNWKVQRHLPYVMFLIHNPQSTVNGALICIICTVV